LNLSQLQEEIDNIKVKEDTNIRKMERLLEEKEEIEAELELLKEESIKNKQIEENFKKDEKIILETINKNEIKLQGFLSSLNLYKNMETAYEGYYQGTKNILKAVKNKRISNEGFIGPVAELLKVDKTYEKAIDISLGSSVQNIIMESEASAKNLVEYLRNHNLGRATFLPLNTIRGNVLNINIEQLKKYGVLGLGHNVIQYKEEYNNIFKYLLGRIIIIDNLNNGLRLANRFGHRYKIVTLDGDLLNPGGSLTGGSYGKNTISLISRKNKITNLSENIDKLQLIIKDKKREKRGITKKLENIMDKNKQIDLEIKTLESEALDTSNRYDNLLDDKSTLEENLIKSTSEIKELKKEMDNLRWEKNNNKNILKELENKSEIVKKDTNILKYSLENNNPLYEKLSGVIADLRIEINTSENNIRNLQKEIDRKTQENIDNDLSYKENSNKIKELEKEISTIIENKDKLSRLIKETENNETHISAKMEEYIDKKEYLMKDYYNKEKDIRDIDKTISILEKQNNNNSLKLSKVKLKLEIEEFKLLDNYELNFQEARKYEREISNITKARNRVAKLKTSIKNIGNVNLASIEEHKSVKERLEFLNNQHDDLSSSKKDLNLIIEDMEEKMEKIFKKSFSEINRNFSEIFISLFNGGRASLQLSDMDNILESGIEIQAQPPGKRLQSLSLLSGGEKSLTAVALLFAIFKTRPSPFCILDEIDAALDEANIGRYTEFLKSFQEETQFILITHRKTTMEIANILYGVTMAEEGVSKLISVELKDFIENIAS